MKVRKFRERIVQNKNSHKCQIGPVIGSLGRIPLRMNGIQIKLSTNFTFTAENPYNLPLYSMPSDQLHLVRHSWISTNSQKAATKSTKLDFPSTSQQIWTLQTGSTWCSREHLMMHSCRYRKVSVRSAHISTPVWVRKFAYHSRNGFGIVYVILRTVVARG